MSPGRNKPGPGTIRAFASAGLAGVGWPAGPRRRSVPALISAPPYRGSILRAGCPLRHPRRPYSRFSGQGEKGQGRLFSPLSARQGEVSLPDHRPALCQSPSGPTRVGVAHTLTSAPTAQLIRSGLTPEPRPAINTVGTGASAAPKSSGLHSGLHSGFHRPEPDLSPTGSPAAAPASWTPWEYLDVPWRT